MTPLQAYLNSPRARKALSKKGDTTENLIAFYKLQNFLIINRGWFHLEKEKDLNLL